MEALIIIDLNICWFVISLNWPVVANLDSLLTLLCNLYLTRQLNELMSLSCMWVMPENERGQNNNQSSPPFKPPVNEFFLVYVICLLFIITVWVNILNIIITTYLTKSTIALWVCCSGPKQVEVAEAEQLLSSASGFLQDTGHSLVVGDSEIYLCCLKNTKLWKHPLDSAEKICLFVTINVHLS